jgi:hypothetical protein
MLLPLSSVNARRHSKPAKWGDFLNVAKFMERELNDRPVFLFPASDGFALAAHLGPTPVQGIPVNPSDIDYLLRDYVIDSETELHGTFSSVESGDEIWLVLRPSKTEWQGFDYRQDRLEDYVAKHFQTVREVKMHEVGLFLLRRS